MYKDLLKLSEKKIDVLILTFLLISAVLYALLTHNSFWGIAIFPFAAFTIPPALYLSIRKKKNWRKILLAVILFGAVMGFSLDFLAEYNQAWTVLSLLPLPKLFGIEPVDNWLAYMFMTFLTIVFYQHFFDSHQQKPINHNWIAILLLGIPGIAWIIFASYVLPHVIFFPYPYLLLGSIAFVLPSIFLILRSSYIRLFLLAEAYFFILYLTIELFAVTYNWWIYPSQYIGLVTIMDTTFPFEEFFFWIFLYTPSLLSYYELFIHGE